MEIQNYLEQGRAALAQGQAREAAIAYAHAAQLEPNNPAVHLGLAQANLALGNYPVVKMASREVMALQPENGYETKIAQALLDLLDHQYERALQSVETAIDNDPSAAYVHALRSYLLRANGQDYDADVARKRAIRLSYGGRFENCFPPLDPVSVPKKANGADPGSARLTANPANDTPPNEHETVPNWSRPNTVRRQAIRTGFFLNQNPGFVTNAIVAILLVLYLFSSMNPYIYVYGAFSVADLGQVWRFVTSLFMYFPDPAQNILSVIISVLSLFFIGREVERFYGPYRYLGIYLLTGILGNIACVVATLSGVAVLQFGVGPAGSLLGIFGAIGVIYFVNKRRFGGFGTSAMTIWIFWLVLNFALAWSAGGLPAVGIELFCVLMGMVVAYLLFPRSGRGRSLW